MEEGGQNFAKNMALDYVDKHYNPDSAKNTYDMMNSLGNAFNQAYGTIDGWKGDYGWYGYWWIWLT